ncbi:MAG TPA: helix-hairpin-helix domain-containing protein [Flavobacterium sp.]|jgi:DNA uptake protein ComE-like DNA-binding protein|nr:helix-hairpin-helix domain-containing protein [Flavobacterium sp.]
MKKLKSYFWFSSEHRSGIFLLLFLIVGLQLAWYIYNSCQNTTEKINVDEKEWMANQAIIDSLKLVNEPKKYELKPFNPNFISDYKGYLLGMSINEIDRLHQFRKKNKYVNSASEFQEVTQVSDSLLNAISPFFKFPDWVKNKKPSSFYEKKEFVKKEKINLLDINQATKEDLIKVYGIGEAISIRILKEKEKFGGFVSMEQMKDIWGLSPEVIENLNKSFEIKDISNIKKIPINIASMKELSAFPYFRYPISKNIITYRSMNGDVKIEDLSKIKDFPVEKINIIALYLQIDK